ncbi:MAG: hypothetical protein MJY55_06350 [Bacteroidales bacterium]|nr:hypothetical protein [Bacteroidales bacterium]
MNRKLLTISLAALIIGLLGSCSKDNGPKKSILPEGALAGEFSVSDTKKVYFSKGNLVATIDASGNPTAWKFAANQYDCLGEGGANSTIGISAGDVDLFGWSTENSNYGIDNTIEDFVGEFVDWGKEIGDGHTWRTLSNDEWVYLFNTRSVNGGTGAGKSYSLEITHGGKKGLVLYPDNYTGGVLSGTVNTLPEGVVFLTSEAGYRGHTGVKVNGIGEYWSSSVCDAMFIYRLGFTSSYVVPDGRAQRHFGNSVRLVTESK